MKNKLIPRHQKGREILQARQMKRRKEAKKWNNSISGVQNRMMANFNQIVEKQPVSTPYGYTYDPSLIDSDQLTQNTLPAVEIVGKRPNKETRDDFTPTQNVQPKNDNSKQKTESSKSQSNKSQSNTNETPAESTKKNTKAKLIPRKETLFYKAWKEARDNGDLTFDWKGQEFTTQAKDESEKQWLKAIGKTKEDLNNELNESQWVIPDTPLPVISITPTQSTQSTQYNPRWQNF